MKDVRLLLVDPISRMGRAFEDSEARLASPNLGLLSLATYLSSRGVAAVRVMDMAASDLDCEDIVSAVREFEPHAVGLTSKTFNIPGAYEVAESVKRLSKEAVVIVGGSHATALPERTLAECSQIDAVVRGEGELTLFEIVERLSAACRDAHELFGQVRGVTYRGEDGTLHASPDRDLISDLDSLPFTDFSLVDYEKYGKRYDAGTRMLQHRYPIFHGRGCPFRCTFCMSPQSYRLRDSANVLDEIEQMHERWGAGFIFFEDSTFLPDRKQFESFCAQYKERGLHRLVHWGFGTRIDTAYPLMFEQAREAGCVQTFFGIESGSELILAKARKKFSKQRIVDIVQAAKDAGIPQVRASFILGLPYETMDTARETLDLIGRLPLDGLGVGLLDVYPGTDVFDMAERGEGGLQWLPGKRLNWESYARSEVQVTANGLSEQDLVQLRDEALARGRQGIRERRAVAAAASAHRLRRRVGRLAKPIIARLRHRH